MNLFPNYFFIARKVFIAIGLLCYHTADLKAQKVASLLKDSDMSGSITLYDLNNDRWYYSDEKDADLPMQPASTFKIINLLIGLDTKTIRDEGSVIPWPGSTDTAKYGYRPEIYKDISIEEAFKVSAGWAFIEMAKKIPRSTYRNLLSKNSYGNFVLSETGADFWNFGSMKISPKNQIDFLVKLYLNRTSFSRKHTEILKRVMVNIQNDSLILRAKTGWTRTEGNHIGWWVGYVELKKNVYFFASRIVSPLDKEVRNFSRLRKEVVRDAFSEQLGIALPIE